MIALRQVMRVLVGSVAYLRAVGDRLVLRVDEGGGGGSRPLGGGAAVLRVLEGPGHAPTQP